MVREHATVFIGGHPPLARAVAGVPVSTLVVAADSGWHHAVAAGFAPDVLVGDLDSIGARGLADARESGCEIVAHPADKDETDAELAVAHALASGARTVCVVSGGGDRPDHVLAMLHSLAAESLDGVAVEGWLGGARLVVCRPGTSTRLGTRPGDTVSLVPVGGDATATATGLRWPLENSVLHVHSSRGVSNVATSDAEVTVHDGRIIVFVAENDR